MRTIQTEAGGQTIEIELHEPDGTSPSTVVVMVHGGPGGNLDGPADLFAHITPAVLEQGCAVARFNLRGSGAAPVIDPATATVRSGVVDVEAVVGAVRRESYKRLVLYAESMGATMALLSLCTAEFDASILLWPALNLFDTDLRDFLTSDQLARSRAEGSLSLGDDLRVGAEFLRECLIYDAGTGAARLRGPVLVIHGDADEEVPHTHGARAAAILGPDVARLITVSGANHGLKQPHERELVVSETVDFLARLT
jgi:pimeloyl-ACP methyl ester carboxylesterase